MSALSTTEAAQRIANAERERATLVERTTEPVSISQRDPEQVEVVEPVSVTDGVVNLEQVEQAVEQVEAQAKQAEDEAKQAAADAKKAAADAKKKAADDKKVKTVLKRAKLSENSELTDDQRNRALDPGNRKGDTLAKFILHGENGGTPATDKPADNKPGEPVEQDSNAEFDAAQLRTLGGKPGYAAYVAQTDGTLRYIGLFAGQDRTTMAKAARAALAKMEGMTAETAATCEIVSARPSNLRRTPALSR